MTNVDRLHANGTYLPMLWAALGRVTGWPPGESLDQIPRTALDRHKETAVDDEQADDQGWDDDDFSWRLECREA